MTLLYQFACVISFLFSTTVLGDSNGQDYSLHSAMLNYTDGRNYTYSPSWFVVILHRMPHFNEYAINHEADFDGGNSDEAKAYQNSLIGFPILMAILTVVIIAFLQLFMFGYF